MKFEKPELKVTLFTLKDVLTASGGGNENDVSAQTDTFNEGSCIGTMADDLIDDCV